MNNIITYTNKCSLNGFIIEAGRPKGSKNKPKDGTVVDAEDVNLDDIKTGVKKGKRVPADNADDVKPGKTADENGTGGVWAVDEPSSEDEAEWSTLDPKNVSRNMRRVLTKFNGKGIDFMVLGEAGWAKTAFIKKAAKLRGYHVLTVYLDKAVATDLGGIPVPSETKNKVLYMRNSTPGWALYMAEHPDQKFLLFFDEMNQAAPDVQNALMPIILEHEVCGIRFKNMIVGAAGNMSYENEGVSELSRPLQERLSIIEWETHTEETWNDHFKFAHKEYDDLLGPEFIDKIAEMKDYWRSPRAITRYIYDWAINNMGEKIIEEPEEIYASLKKNCYGFDIDDDTRSLKTATEKLAQYMYDYVSSGGKVSDDKKSRKQHKGTDQVNEEDKKAIINCLVKGYWFNSSANDPDNGDDEKYVCTVENAITSIFPPEITGINAEVFRKILKEMEANGKTPKFQTNEQGFKECKKNGWHTLETKDGHDYVDGERVNFSVGIKKHITVIDPEAKKEEKPSRKHTND